MASKKKDNKVAQPIEDIWDGRLGVGTYQIIQPSFSALNSLLDAPSTLFPSLDPKNKAKIVEIEKLVPTAGASVATSASSVLLAQETVQAQKAVEVFKRPVGRPRIHPKKEVDPNRIKRVAKGDKPLGRPRTSHLKPPKVKRPKGRPRKDASKEIILTPMDELVRTALTEEWRNSFALGVKGDNGPAVIPAKPVGDVPLAGKKVPKV